MIGRTISHYRIVEELGAGGMGVVYMAEDTHLGRRVAFKTLTTRGGDNQHFRARFLREARAVSALSHPNIAAIYDYGETDQDEPYIVMELIKGETLSDLMHKEKLTIPRSIEIIKQVAEALGEAHSQGIIHRDIKPSNVAINERGNVKVLDFGLAKQIQLETPNPSDPEQRTLMNTQTREGVIVGTPLYLSPEQALGVDLDARSDLFTLGSLLYECITGKPAFLGNKPAEIIANILREDPPLPSKVNPDVPEEVDEIVKKALAKKPEARYQNAEEMIADLEDARSSILNLNRTVTRMDVPANGTHPTGALATLSDIFRRPRLSIGYVAAALVLLVLIVGGILWWRQPSPHVPLAAAQKFYDIGTEALRSGSYFQASKAFELAIQNDEQFALAHARQAEALIELDNPERAKDEMLRVSELTPDRSSLPPIDALYRDAITATVRRDFPKAVEHYQKIAQLSGQPYAWVDLGRAFERNEQPDKALAQYEAALSKDPLYATAFLRAAVIYTKTGKSDAAIEKLQKAEQIYQAQGNSEGRTEVLFQRGTLLDKTGKLQDAQTQLQQALDIARTTGNLSQQIQAMLQISSVAVDAGDIARAQQSAQQAIDLATSQRSENLAAGGLINLGSVYLAHGDYPLADEAYKRALSLAQQNKGRGNEALASANLASLRLQQRNAEEAQRYAEAALNFYRQGNYRKEASQTTLILGRAKRLRGDYDGAIEVFEQQLKTAEGMGDKALIGQAHSELGAALEQQERYSEALTHYQQRYALSKDAGDEKGMSNALTNSAGMMWRLGDYDGAANALKEATAIADKPTGGYKAVLAAIYQYEGELELSQAHFNEAIKKSEDAIKVAGEQYVDVVIRAKRVAGLAKSLSGNKRDGQRLCDESVQLASKTQDPRLIATSTLALAEATLLSGDAKFAIDLISRVIDKLGSANQWDSEWRACVIAARANEESGDPARAKEYATRARATLTKLEQRFSTDIYKQYLSRQDLQTYQQQLAAFGS